MSAVHCCATHCEDAHQKQSKMAQKGFLLLFNLLPTH